MRAIFFDEEDAEAVARKLLLDGFDARVERERLAGEDDEEDQPWAVVSAAPAVTLELLVDAYDGWLDEGAEAPPRTAPELPSAPRRHHRPPG